MKEIIQAVVIISIINIYRSITSIGIILIYHGSICGVCAAVCVDVKS